jgi:hypothetical protein
MFRGILDQLVSGRRHKQPSFPGLKRKPGVCAGLSPRALKVYGQSGRLAAAVVEPVELAEFPLLLDGDELLLVEGDILLVEGDALEPALGAAPEVVDPVLAAVFRRACPVVLSLQCVAADTLALPLAEGEVDVDGEVVD